MKIHGSLWCVLDNSGRALHVKIAEIKVSWRVLEHLKRSFGGQGVFRIIGAQILNFFRKI
jgi:hypothetical protein